MQYNIYEAKTNLSQIVKQVLSGEEVIIAKSGKPAVKMIPIHPIPTDRVPGSAKGTIEIKDNFDDPLPEDILKAFSG